MPFRPLLVGVFAAAAIAGCGSSSSASTIGQLCGRYASAVAQIVPKPLPAPVPQDFAAKLGAQADQTCVKHAVELGYASGAQKPGQVKITHARATRLINDLTADTRSESATKPPISHRDTAGRSMGR
jgi:hypothetical protein